jgi:glycosyltransferase involved in cell wall biosynthesis
VERVTTISLVSIVKNEAQALRPMLDSVRPLVDEWIIVDTGSTDETPGIINEFSGAVRTLPFEDFVTTKNKALAMATGDYVLFMDADERLLSGVEQLRQHIEAGADCVLGRIVEGDPDRPSQVYYRARLWKNHGQFQFEGPGVHEYIALHGRVVYDGSIRVFHDHRQRTPESYRERFTQYKAILENRLSVAPGDTRAMFYLARALRDLNLPWQAIERYEQYLGMGSGFIDECWQAAYDMAHCWLALKEHRSAQLAIERAQAIDPRRAEAWTLAGLLLFNAQDFAGAAEQFKHALSLPVPEDVLLFVEPHHYSDIPREHLAICLDRLKDYRGALDICEQTRRALPQPATNNVNNLHWLRSRTHLKLFFTLGETPEPVQGEMLERIGAGGLETAYLELPAELARLGHDVFMFCRCEREHVANGVRFIPWQSYGDYTRLSADVIVTSRWFDALYTVGTAHAKKVLWLHDSHFADPNHDDAWSLADRVVVASDWHRNYTAQRLGHSLPLGRLTVIPLGIRKALFTQAVTRDPRQVIYSSNPDRGLYLLRDMWPEIVARCPDIHLVVTYGWEGLQTWSSDPGWQAKIESDRAALLSWAQQAGNVRFTGRLNKRDLAREMLRSALCLYPNNYQETFCLTVLETQASGVPMVTTRYGALADTLDQDHNVVIPLDPYSAEYRRRFIEETADLYHDKARREAWSAQCSQRILAAECDWSDVGRMWERMLFEVV